MGDAERRPDPVDESLVIEMINARTRVLEEYVRCLEAGGGVTPCEPPRPIQLPPQEEVRPDRDLQSEAMINSAARTLRAAEIRATKAHAECMRKHRKDPGRCGPAP